MRSNNHWMLLCAVVAVIAPLAGAEDWPQFRGPDRDGKSGETGLLKTWPEGGPKQLWISDADLGAGWSSMSIVKESIYTTGTVKGQGWIFALDLRGKLKWKKKYGREWTKNFPAARTTPTFDDGLLYIMSGEARIACYDTSGRPIWSVDTRDKYGAQKIRWGIAESPLVFDDTVVCTPGGTGATMVAFDKETGKEKWTASCGNDKSSYTSPILIRDGQKDLIVTMTERNVIGVGAKGGKLLWKIPYPSASKTSRCGAHPNHPVYHADQVYVSTGYDDGGLALALSADGSQASRAWANPEHDNHHGGIILLDGHLYASTWHGNRDGNWMCIDWKQGKVRYDTHWENKGQMIYADGMLYCYAEKTGAFALVRATPKAFKPICSFKITAGEGEHWAHPALADGVLYVRHGSKLMAYDVKAK